MIKINCLVFEEAPANFNPQVDVVGCYCECGGKVLLLKRHPEKPQGNSWGLPAGKLEKVETLQQGVIREVFEETGITLPDVNFLGSLYVIHPDLDFMFHVFYKHFDVMPEIQLGTTEHLECRWVTLEEALNLPLIGGGHEVLRYAVKKITTIS